MLAMDELQKTRGRLAKLRKGYAYAYENEATHLAQGGADRSTCEKMFKQVSVENGAFQVENAAALDRAFADGWAKGQPTGAKAASPLPPRGELEVRAASTFTLRTLEWFWKFRIPLGKFSLLGGLPDKGKGLLTCFLCSCATADHPFPMDEGRAPQGNVVILSGEDDPEDTIVPRLAAAGANLDRVHIVRMMRDPDGRNRVFSMLTDLDALRAAIDKISNVVLVIIDPISAYVGVGKVNSSVASDVRGFLQPFCDLAAERNFAFLGVTHLNKKADVGSAMLRFSDSLAYVALARSVYMAAEDPDTDGQRIFARVKGNLGPDKKAMSYMVGVRVVGTDQKSGKDIEAPYLEWGHKYIEVTANEAMQAESGGARNRTERKEASEFLLDRLADGPVLATTLITEAAAQGIAERTLRRAQHDLGVTPKKDGGRSYWQLPEGKI